MEPELIIFAIGLLLMVLYGASQAWTWQRSGGPARLVTLAGWGQQQTPILRVKRTTRPHDYPYTPALRARRDALIAAGLRLGYTPAQLAEVWRYAPRSVGRRAAVLAGTAHE